MPKNRLLINPISIPLSLGVYHDNELQEEFTLDGMASEVLLEKVSKILDAHKIEEIIYVNGPGTHMATKLTYVMLESIRITRGIEFFACSAFELNGNAPVKAIGNLYFIKEKVTIITQKFDEKSDQTYIMPKMLDSISLENDRKPNYILPAVQR